MNITTDLKHAHKALKCIFFFNNYYPKRWSSVPNDRVLMVVGLSTVTREITRSTNNMRFNDCRMSRRAMS